jgi:3-dehydroquinate dehydratase
LKQSTLEALLRAYDALQEVISDLYREYDKAVENEDNADATLLEIRADRLFVEADSMLLVIMEYQSEQ